MFDRADILLVEDSREDADLAIRALKKKKLANNLVHISDGAAALEWIKAHRTSGNMPIMILLDLKLPKVNGVEILTAVKSDPAISGTPVIILTSSHEDPDIKRCYDLGANSYIVKPIDFAKFTAAVSDIGHYWMVLNQPPSPKSTEG